MDKWNKRFLNLAKHISTWSKDKTQVGAVIVNPITKNIVGIGYNGFPRGVEETQDRLGNRDVKLKLTAHAELNAILNSNTSVRGCEIYVYPTMMKPNCCPECAKAIAQSGIIKVHGFDTNDLSPRWEELQGFSETILRESGVQFICEEIEDD